MLSTGKAFQIALIRYCQSVQLKRKSFRQIPSMSQDTELVTAAHFPYLLHFSIQLVHFRQTDRLLIPYFFHNESNGIFPEPNQQTAGLFGYKIIIRMVKIAKGH